MAESLRWQHEDDLVPGALEIQMNTVLAYGLVATRVVVLLVWLAELGAGNVRAAENSGSESDEPWLQPYRGPTRTDIDATTLDGKVLCGYQG
jgi:hypothetical protein